MITSLPSPQVFDPGVGPALRWGLCGLGDIAASFTEALHRHSVQRVVTAGSRSLERAQEFSARHGIDHAVGSYEQVVNDESVDIVYVSVPDAFHQEIALMAIAAGKHVLVEKPFAMDAAGGRMIADAARAAGVYAMEGMWARYLPQASILRQLVSNGDLGEVRAVEASFGFAVPYDPFAWMWQPKIGGGALLAFGVYPISYATMVLGSPTQAVPTARGLVTQDGVDVHSAAILDYGDRQATVVTSMLAQTPITATVYGSMGYVALDETFVIPSGLQFAQSNGERLVWRDESGIVDRGGLCYEAAAAAAYISEGRTESPIHTLDDTVATLTLIDDIKGQLRTEGRVWSP